jgi:arylsulfatase A-like enzyme
MALVDPRRDTLVVCSAYGVTPPSESEAVGSGHREPAVLMGWGHRARSGVPNVQVDLLDLPPTLYALAGVPAAADMPGKPLTELFNVAPEAPLATRLQARRAAPRAPTADGEDMAVGAYPEP